MNIQQCIAALIAFAVVMAWPILLRKKNAKPISDLEPGIFDDPTQTRFERYALKTLDAKYALKLVHAGLRETSDMAIFAICRPLLAAFIGGTCFFLFLDGGHSAFIFIVTAAGAGLGWWLPGAWLDFRVQARVTEIAVNLPMMFDLIEVCIRGGMSLDAAWHVVQKQMQLISEPLAHEMKSMEFEMRLGVDRDIAIRKMGDRTGVSGFSSLAAMLSQSERFGTGVAETFMIHADALRYEELQSMEERAYIASIKVLIPIAVFLLPAVLLILGGPMLILVIRSLQDIS